MKLINLSNVDIKTDSENRYCLNDLHKAAMMQGKATESQKPSNFLKSNQINGFVQSLTDATKVSSLVKIRGGIYQGTYAHELIVLRYAAWLDTEFELFVYQSFRDMLINGFSYMSKLNAIDKTIEYETSTVSYCARTMRNWGLGGRKSQLHAQRKQLSDQAQIYLPVF